MLHILKQSCRHLVIASAALILSSCAATHVALSKRELDVQARTSNAIFVEPVSQDKRTVYLDVKSGVMEFDRNAFKQFVAQQFADNGNGYRIVNDPDSAHFTMVAYVLNLEKTSPSAAEVALNQGYMGGAIAGGAVTGALASNSYRGAAAGGLLGGAAELVGGALVKDVTYMLVCDVQIKERTKHGAIVRKDTQIDAKVSDAGSSRQTVSEVSNQKEYRTRIVSTANKANLKLEDAQDLMFQKTAYALSGFF